MICATRTLCFANNYCNYVLRFASNPSRKVGNALYTSSGLSERRKCLVVPSNYVSQSRQYTNRNILSLHQRGLWKERFPESCEVLEKIMKTGDSVGVYAGFDPTADSLHIGNLLVLMSLLHCQRAGHTPIVLLGGFTGTVGDPSGQRSSRPDLPEHVAEENSAIIKTNIMNIFGNHDRIFWKDGDKEPLSRPIYLNNADWLTALSLTELFSTLSFLSIPDLLRSSYIKDRLNKKTLASPTAKELLYQVLQAYDWLYLYDKYNCRIQVGGNDQLANMWLGHDLIRDARKDSVTGLTVPLITTAGGEKLGKSSGNALWLSNARTSYFEFYQYFFRKTDSEVEELLKLFTFLSLPDIQQLMKRHWEKPEAYIAQKKLAESVTLLVHGEYGLDVAVKCTDVLYRNNSAALLDLTGSDLENMFKGFVTKLPLQPGTTVAEAAMLAQCFPSQKTCEQGIRAGGFRINQCRVDQPQLALIPDAHVLPSGYSLFKVGKKNYTLVQWQQ